jgi:hypothetical protein
VQGGGHDRSFRHAEKQRRRQEGRGKDAGKNSEIQDQLLSV